MGMLLFKVMFKVRSVREMFMNISTYCITHMFIIYMRFIYLVKFRI